MHCAIKQQLMLIDCLAAALMVAKQHGISRAQRPAFPSAVNHAARFWREVERVCPDYKTAERWLKQRSSLPK